MSDRYIVKRRSGKTNSGGNIYGFGIWDSHKKKWAVSDVVSTTRQAQAKADDMNELARYV